MTKRQTNYTIIASFLAMFILAVTESIRGVLIPTFKIDFNVTDTSIGGFLLFASLSYVVFTFFAGRMVRKFGQKKTIILGMAISGFGFLGTSFSVEFYQLVLGYFILTIGISFLVMSLNTIVPLLKVSYFAVIMNLLHFFYGFGATVTQRVAGYLITEGISWRHIFIVFFMMYMFGIVVYSFVKQPPRKETAEHHDKVHRYEIPLVIMFSLSLGFYITSEIQTANWLLNYLKEIYQFTENNASVYLATFFASLSIGRLVGGYILERIGYVRGILITLLLAFIFYSIGLLNESTIILISISGFFFAIVYPTTILVIQRFFEENVSVVITIVTMTASLVSMFFGWFIGFLNDQIGVELSYLLIPGSILMALLFMIGIAINMKHVEKIRGEKS